MTSLDEARKVAGNWLIQKAVAEIAQKNPLYAYFAQLVEADLGSLPKNGSTVIETLVVEQAPQKTLPPPKVEEQSVGEGERAARYHIHDCIKNGQPINTRTVGLYLGTDDAQTIRRVIKEIREAYQRIDRNAVSPSAPKEKTPASKARPVPDDYPTWFHRLPERTCPVCGQRLVPQWQKVRWEVSTAFENRKTCGRACSQKFRWGG